MLGRPSGVGGGERAALQQDGDHRFGKRDQAGQRGQHEQEHDLEPEGERGAVLAQAVLACVAEARQGGQDRVGRGQADDAERELDHRRRVLHRGQAALGQVGCQVPVDQLADDRDDHAQRDRAGEDQDASERGVLEVDARAKGTPEVGQAGGLEGELAERADHQADRERGHPQPAGEQHDGHDHARVVGGVGEGRQGEAVPSVEDAGEDAGQALEDHGDQRDAEQRGGELLLAGLGEAATDQADQRLGEDGEHRRDQREGERGDGQDDADQSQQVLLVLLAHLDEDGHEGRGDDGADQQVVQDQRQGAGEDVGIGARGRAERGGDDLLAHQAEPAAQDVAESDDGGGAGQPAAGDRLGG